MIRHLALGLCLLAVSAAAQDTEVKGARISLVRKPAAVLNVTIENRRDSPLVEVQIGLTQRGAGKPSMFSTRYFGETPPNETVKPRERRVLETSIGPDFDVETATLRLVAFADGYYEGVAAALEPWRKARQARVDDLRYWTGVFDLMPRVSETDLRAYLASRLADRAPVVQDSLTSGVRWKLQEVLRRYPSGPDVWAGLDRLRAETQSELAVLTQQPATLPPAAGPVTSAAILTQDRAASTTLVAAIENLRTVPIEAFGFEVVDSDPRRGTSGLTSDFCESEDKMERGHGRIQPREIREIALGGTVSPTAELPFVRLTLLMFDDLSYEGKAAARDELLRRRERQAEDNAFTIAALGELTARPAAEILPFLVEKRAERARELQAAGGLPGLMAIDHLVQEAKDSPDRLLASVKDRQEYLERQRQRLLRHVGR
jgi:hypothetical protein